MTLNKKSRSIYKKSRRTRTHGTRKRRISRNRLRYLKGGSNPNLEDTEENAAKARAKEIKNRVDQEIYDRLIVYRGESESNNEIKARVARNKQREEQREEQRKKRREEYRRERLQRLKERENKLRRFP
jgi:hypothetical protein